MKEKNKCSLISKGIIRENPVLVLMLGTCPTLATTTSVSTALGMGIATAIVLICSNVFISLLRKIIPEAVRIPCYIVVIAGFVSLVQMLVQAYLSTLYDALGVFLPLIVVNCVILGRAEMFAGKNKPVDAALDGIGMGLGFILTLVVMGAIREIFGSGSFWGIDLPFFSTYNIPILVMPAGGFFVFGCMIAMVAKWTHGKVKHGAVVCENCPNAATCGKIGKVEA